MLWRFSKARRLTLFGLLGLASTAGIMALVSACGSDEDTSVFIPTACDLTKLSTTDSSEKTVATFEQSARDLLARATTLEPQFRDVCNAMNRDLGVPEGADLRAACNSIAARLAAAQAKAPTPDGGTTPDWISIKFDDQFSGCRTDTAIEAACVNECGGGDGGTCDPLAACQPAGAVVASCTGTCAGDCRKIADGPCNGECRGVCSAPGGGADAGVPACAGECVGTCTAATWTGRCTTGCQGAFVGTCLGQCDGVCSGAPVGAPMDAGADAALTPGGPLGAGNCAGTCIGKCSASASGTCTGARCAGENGFAGGTCTGAGACKGECRSSSTACVTACKGVCTEESTGTCAATCQGTCSEGASNAKCEGTVGCAANTECTRACRVKAALATTCGAVTRPDIRIVGDFNAYEAVQAHIVDFLTLVQQLRLVRTASDGMAQQTNGNFRAIGVRSDNALLCVQQALPVVEQARSALDRLNDAVGILDGRSF